MLGTGSKDIGADIKFEVISDSPLDRYSLGDLFPQEYIFWQDESKKEKANDSEEASEGISSVKICNNG